MKRLRIVLTLRINIIQHGCGCADDVCLIRGQWVRLVGF